VHAASFDRVRGLGGREEGLAVVFAVRGDGSSAGSVVNAGVLDHPVTGEAVVGFVARGHAKKLAYVRERPRLAVVFRSGPDWVTVEGDAELAGPEDALVGFAGADLPQLIRRVYAAAVGGAEDEWAELDAVTDDEHHTAVLVRPVRVYSNPR
jgi:hypothetical protein